MSVKIRMHEYSPQDGHVLRRFRVKLADGHAVTFKDGHVYDVSDEDAAYLLTVRSRPDSDLPRFPFAFEEAEEVEPTAPTKVAGSGDLKAADLPSATKPKTKKPRTRKPQTKKPPAADE